MCLRCRVYQTLLALHSNVITASSFRHSYGHRSGPIPAIGMAIPVSTIIHPIPTLGTEPLTGTTPERRMESCRVVEMFGPALPELIRRLDATLRSTSSHWLLLLTVHEAKGGEWSHVFVHEDLKLCMLDDEERQYRLNLTYVAMTRAVRTLLCQLLWS